MVSGLADTNGGHWLTGGGIRPAIDPDIVLLHIGTNDVWFQAGAIDRLDNLVNHIFTLRPKTTLFLASLIPRPDRPEFDSFMAAYNASIPGIVKKYQAAGDNVFYVDMHSKLDPKTDYQADKIHPNAAGYNKMGDAWYAAIQAATVPEPSAMVLFNAALISLLCYAWHKRK